LLGDKRNELLALREVEQYGRDSFRTAVECTRDRLAGLIGRDVAADLETACPGPAFQGLMTDICAAHERESTGRRHILSCVITFWIQDMEYISPAERTGEGPASQTGPGRNQRRPDYSRPDRLR